MTNSSKKKPKASERLDALEGYITRIKDSLESLEPVVRRVGELELLLFNLSRETEVLRDALQLIHEKQEVVIGLINDGKDLSLDNINEKAIELKALSLKDRVDQGLKEGKIIAVDEVTEKSLIISRELDQDGTVANPRLQFALEKLIPEIKEKFVGKKVGELVKTEDGKYDIEIMEIYDFVDQTEEATTEEASEESETETKE